MVLLEPRVRVADRAEHAIVQVRLPPDKVDDPIAELVASLGLGTLLHGIPDLGAQGVDRLDVADAGGEGVTHRRRE